MITPPFLLLPRAATPLYATPFRLAQSAGHAAADASCRLRFVSPMPLDAASADVCCARQLLDVG